MITYFKAVWGNVNFLPIKNIMGIMVAQAKVNRQNMSKSGLAYCPVILALGHEIPQMNMAATMAT